LGSTGETTKKNTWTTRYETGLIFESIQGSIGADLATTIMGLSASRQDSVDAFIELCEGVCTEDALLGHSSSENHVVNACSSSGKLALVAALESGNGVATQWLLQDPFGNLRINNVSDEEGTSALLAACATEDEQLGLVALRTMFQRWSTEIKFNQCDTVNGWGALHHCAYHGYSESAVLVLEAERLRVQDYPSTSAAALLDHYGQSPLHIAASRGEEQVICALLKYCYSSNHSGVDLDWKDREGQTALDVADSARIRDVIMQHSAHLANAGEC
jgi:hypothetical protein